MSVLQAAVGIAAALTVAISAFDAHPSVHLGAGLCVFVLAMAAMYAVGMVVAAVAPTPNAAVAIGLTAFFAIGALGGMFGGRDALPDAVATIGECLPFGAAVQSMSAAWMGAAVEPVHLVSLGATTAVGTAVSAMLFRWD